jgi:hypothetical protein
VEDSDSLKLQLLLSLEAMWWLEVELLLLALLLMVLWALGL